MKTRIGIFMVAACSFAALSAYLAVELRNARAATPPMPAPVASAAPLDPETESPDKQLASDVSEPHAALWPDTARKIDVAGCVDEATLLKEPDSPSPATLRYVERRQRVSLREMYGDFQIEEGLDEGKFDWLIGEMVKESVALRSSDYAEGATHPSRMAAREAAHREFAQRVDEVLGTGTAERLKFYRESFVARSEVEGVAATLDEAALPLTEQQRLQLKEFLVADYRRFPNPIHRPQPGHPIESTRRAMVEWNQDRWARYEGKLRTVLSDEQYGFIEDSRQAEKEGHAW